MIGNNLLYLSGILLLFTLNSCNNSGNSENQMDAKSEETSGLVSDTGKQVKVLSLPAPLQVSNALKEVNAEFYQELLGPYDPTKEIAISASHKAIIIGVFGVDMGYSMFNGQKQSAINYFSRIGRLFDDLNIEDAVSPSSVESFRRNINNMDSLIPLTLVAFNNAHNYLEQNKRRSDGLLILAGCFVEGLHISLGHAMKKPSKEILSVVGQQKLYLDNFIELFSEYNENSEVAEIMAAFMDLKTIFDQIEIKYSEEDSENKKRIEEIPITDAQLKTLSGKIDAMRKKMLS